MHYETIVNGFLQFSSFLTGIDDLSIVEASEHYNRIILTPGYQDFIAKLVEKYLIDPDHFSESLTQEESNVCKGVVFLWYTAELIQYSKLGEKEIHSQGVESPERYYSALLWQVIRAHPPGLKQSGREGKPPESAARSTLSICTSGNNACQITGDTKCTSSPSRSRMSSRG